MDSEIPGDKTRLWLQPHERHTLSWGRCLVANTYHSVYCITTHWLPTQRHFPTPAAHNPYTLMVIHCLFWGKCHIKPDPTISPRMSLNWTRERGKKPSPSPDPPWQTIPAPCTHPIWVGCIVAKQSQNNRDSITLHFKLLLIVYMTCIWIWNAFFINICNCW